jgi:hypothetical protein
MACLCMTSFEQIRAEGGILSLFREIDSLRRRLTGLGEVFCRLPPPLRQDLKV